MVSSSPQRLAFARDMSDLTTVAHYLGQSVIASTARSAEQQLRGLESQEGFALTLLHVVASNNLAASTRLAGALFFKNFIRRRWVDENGEHLLSARDVELVKKEIVPLMIQLGSHLQVQIGESIAVIADSDFPERWPTLLDDLVDKLSAEDMVTNKGVLTVAHSIFKRWRPLFTSDALYLEIKLVLEKFAGPFLHLLQTVDEQISANRADEAKLRLLFDVLLVLVKLYYDLNCQDIPEFFEDNMQVGMGIMHKYLAYDNPLLEDETEDEEASVVTKVKSSIAELVQLYTSRYEDVFGPMVEQFIQTTWNLLVSLTCQPKYDILVSKCLSFMTAVARIPRYFNLFNNEAAINSVTEKIILPNVTLRDSDVELFEDDPIEYIRRDLEGSDSDTRRRACTDFLKELKEKNESLLTNIVLSHIKKFFEKYHAHPQENWKYKDLCVYLFTSLAVKGNVTSSGVSSTNAMLDVVDFFTKEVMSDLNGHVPHVILRVDAIKYIHTFRNQLTKEQLVEILPVMANFLQDSEYVVYTYAAVTIERILSIREPNPSNAMLFTKNDLTNSAHLLLDNLFGLTLKQNTSPEKLAENEFLMKTIHRILLTAEDSIKPYAMDILNQLLEIIKIIAKNPSNPRFTHFTFESVSVVIRYNHHNLNVLIDTMMPIFLDILAEDIQEFIPYVFQIIAYCLEQIPSGNNIPENVKQLCQPLLSPAVWEMKGNIPAVTRLLKDIIKIDASVYPDLVPVLGVFQRLIASKAYDTQGFELLEYFMNYIPLPSLQPYLKQIAVLLLQRLQSSRTEKYVKKLTVFLGVISHKLGSDFVVQFIDDVQPGLFEQIWSNFIITALPSIGNLLDRKLALIGSLNTVVNGSLFTSRYGSLVVPTMNVILTTAVSESIVHTKSEYINSEPSDEITTFGSSFSRLGTIAEKSFDPLSHIDLTRGVKLYIANILTRLDPSFMNEITMGLSEDAKKALNSLGP
ncbi:AFR273Wp [Eremothecium gossypii ATCC 10895]|uniref:AFR273Wp n=1 Tax=Eremothecium gossypii (strain ATCC 10895 / CBS 109.51 / FGSC 9923 / NRRL Y-1056) TaxID=284811 RepID=Q753N9_EREGS|nr:AFR273Wp [Eremothecium gossypii ATCC 10895]AAS53644.2 AFR273Wp [Eremothecium gossypii ATCC 10895]AEY97957.1 FAFR273Wp [Eremothecium gossypii FDAG1]